MERANEVLNLRSGESEMVSEIVVNPHEPQVGPSFYEDFALRGIRVDRVQPGFIFCTFKVPPRLIDRTGNLAGGAIANLIDIVGNALIYRLGQPMNVSVDMSISYLSNAKLDDELEITSKLLGKIGSVSGTSVIIKNKVSGEIIAEGRHSLFSRLKSKI
ncbi:putative esterase C31F10.02 isoform X2 [Chenopodium quinoa]|uniref:Acyl-coenzyme A thioesterase 13 n=1 Tax=Chenopodium quinoa TaxID=63459 RepID=A0A803LX84_CHEQI|nr:putative esterase C31F10.02 isoform X2 [Chenopodium quinoa]